MENLKITVGNKVYEIKKDSNLLELINDNMPQAKYNIIAAKNDSDIIELNEKINKDLSIEWISVNSEEGLDILRHSTSHIMATAVRRLFPGTKVAIGPSIENGFYYDFDTDYKFSENDFEKIENEMKAIINKDLIFKKEIINKNEAVAKFKKEDEIYKVELLNEIEDEEVSCYTTGDFIDLCRGPHIPSTGYIKVFKLLSVAGAYWRGNEKNKMLQRIYGTCFPDDKSLKAYLNRLKEAAERDHRKIGKEMELFGFYQEGPGFPFWKPNGMLLYNTIVDYWRKIHYESGYKEIKTPIILNEDLWHRSGHWDNYKENMYFTKIDDNDYAVKPMNCPGGLLIYKDGIHSYRELPLKVAELGLVHRHEKSGVLHGLFRVRQFTQDDAHIYCMKDQVTEEVIKVINLTQKIYSDFGFDDVHIELSTRPEKSIGSDEMWELAENALKDSLKKLNIEYQLNPGDGAFYGPKIDFHIKDAIGRSWQCGTIQCDFSMPERFDIHYIGEDGKRHRPVMLHRAIFGSVERFIGIIIEHYKGKFPFWLAPEQVCIIPINELHIDHAKKIRKILQNSNFRVSIDYSNEPLGARIKQARLKRVSHIGIIGENELKNNSITIRKADKEGNEEIKINDLLAYVEKLNKI